MKKLIFILTTLTIFLTLSACGDSNAEQTENDSLRIYTTIYPLAYAIDEIGGNDVTVESIYPNEVDAHHYEPSSKQITEIASGVAFIYLGGAMETSADKIKSALEGQDIEMVNISEQIDIFETHDGQVDPHVWLDPERMISIGETIKETLISIAPDQQADFEKNFETFSENMQALDEAYTNTLDNAQNKKILAVHPAYGYWEAKYGIEQLKVARIGEEPSQKELAEITKEAKANDISAVVFENNHQSKLGEMLIDELDAQKVEIHTLETRTDQDVKNKADYLSIMEDNLETLKEITE